MPLEPLASDLPTVAVCICTYRRPEVLEDLLSTLERCAAEAQEVTTVGVVIVDDDPERSAEAVVERFEHRFVGGTAYDCTGSGNVAKARNRVLELGLARAELLVTIDDDCHPVDEWIRELVVTQRRTDADSVAGACNVRLPEGAPRWLVEEPFLDQASTGIDGAETDSAYLKNCLFKASFLRDNAMTFDLAFGISGGEDAMFLHTARVRGMRQVFAARALVYEKLPPERATLAYQLRRRCWYGNTESLTTVASGSAHRPRAVLRGVKRMAEGLIHPFRRMSGRRTPQLRYAMSTVLQGVGRVLGGLGVRMDHR